MKIKFSFEGNNYTLTGPEFESQSGNEVKGSFALAKALPVVPKSNLNGKDDWSKNTGSATYKKS